VFIALLLLSTSLAMGGHPVERIDFGDNSDGSISVGDKFEGELGGAPKYCVDGVHPYQGYTFAAAFELKAGQNVRISAIVVGKDRKVAVELFDPTGAPLASS